MVTKKIQKDDIFITAFVFGVFFDYYNQMLSLEEKKLIDYIILKQAIRDLASKNVSTSESASKFFRSKSYVRLCVSLDIDKQAMDKSLVELESYPLISRKKLANKMAKMIDTLSFLRES